MNTCTRMFHFDAGHRVPLHSSKCKTPHGHSYKAEVTCSAFGLTDEGFVVDFGVIKALVGAWIGEHWDHTMIIQQDDELMVAMEHAAYRHDRSTKDWYHMPCAPTAENLARHLAEQAQALLEPHNVKVSRVRIWETPNCHADWTA